MSRVVAGKTGDSRPEEVLFLAIPDAFGPLTEAEWPRSGKDMNRLLGSVSEDDRYTKSPGWN